MVIQEKFRREIVAAELGLGMMVVVSEAVNRTLEQRNHVRAQECQETKRMIEIRTHERGCRVSAVAGEFIVTEGRGSCITNLGRKFEQGRK